MQKRPVISRSLLIVANPYVQVNMTRNDDNTKHLLVWGFIPIINEIHTRLFDDHDIVSDIIHGTKKNSERKKNLNKKKFHQSAHSIIMKSMRVYLMTTISSSTSSMVGNKFTTKNKKSQPFKKCLNSEHTQL